jgi:antitoxin (DNA-binding transcriptional repressor) of toxin-antitoxin stability system
MKTMAISRFKALALKIIDDVAKTKEGVVITRRGKPLAQVTPFQNTADKNEPGTLSDTLLFEKDIVTPLGEDMWEASR